MTTARSANDLMVKDDEALEDVRLIDGDDDIVLADEQVTRHCLEGFERS